MDKEKKVGTVIYCRVATKGQTEALEAQRARLRAYAEQQGRVVVAEVLEAAKGLSMNRPGIRELNKLAARCAMDEILAVNMTRIGRKTEDILAFEAALARQNIQVNTPEENSLLLLRTVFEDNKRGPQA